MGNKLKILFLCTGHSCRSRMAEGWATATKGDVIEAYSAGIETRGLNPLAVRVMAQSGTDCGMETAPLSLPVAQNAGQGFLRSSYMRTRSRLHRSRNVSGLFEAYSMNSGE